MESTHPEISIIIVGYKSKKYLDACLKSIEHQTFYSPEKVEVIFINNGSFDGSIRLIQRNYRWVSTLRNMKNVGVAVALNQGIKYCSGKYVLVMSTDVILEKDYLEKAYKKMEYNKRIAAIMGKIYKYNFNQSGKTPYLDSVGIFSVVDREILSARGVRDEGQFEDSEQIFSVRNICAMYRKDALEDVKIDDEYFDENFFLYLEDVDLCWRLNLFGWKVYFLPELISYHLVDSGKKAALSESQKKERLAFIKNERLMIIKNEFFLTIMHDFWLITKKRFCKKTFFIEGGVSHYLRYLSQIPKAIKKRGKIKKRKRVSRLEMRKWFIRSNNSRYLYYKSKSLYIYAKFPPTY
ncbi:glycosyltransferase family 2 protein [bacterium]|nr:glycosyltransferase family 2 protein [bacterium]